MTLRSLRGLAPVLLWALAAPALAQNAAPTASASLAYQQPPAPIAAILDARPTPGASVSPDNKVLALLDRSNLPPSPNWPSPMLRLAGYRINPRNNGPANSADLLADGAELPVGRRAARRASSPCRPEPASRRPPGRRTASGWPSCWTVPTGWSCGS
jgi:hypothetical protein